MLVSQSDRATLNIDAKVLQKKKLLADLIQQRIKKITYPHQQHLSQECKDGSTYINQ